MHTQIAFAIYRTYNEKPGGGRPFLFSLFRSFFLGGERRKIVKCIYVISFPSLFSFFLFTNIVHVYITNSPSHTDNYVYFLALKKEEEKGSSDFAQSFDFWKEYGDCVRYSEGRTTRENSFTKYFWINCLVLLFAKYNNKWLIMVGIFLFDWY